MGSIRRVLFVGMNPGVERHPTVQRYSAIGRLHQWCERMGIPYHSFVNVYAHAGAFRADQVDREFLLTVISLHNGPVVALGGTASTILKRLKVEHLTMPHPSYRNRKLNDAAYEEECLRQCLVYLNAHQSPEGSSST